MPIRRLGPVALLPLISLAACNSAGDLASVTGQSDDVFVSSAALTATGNNPPIIFNSSASARPGDIVSLQGHNFGGNPTVLYQTSVNGNGTALPIISKVGDQVSVQIPNSATGAIYLQVNNGSGISASVKMNGAKGYHFDALRIVPGGQFRIFGRNLQLAGSTALVTVDGQTATVNASQSNEHMLTVTAPANLAAKPNAIVTVDNGNGTGAANVERTADVWAGQSASPFDASVGWTARFRPLTSNFVELPCQNGKPVSQQLQQIINSFPAQGGIVQLGQGQCVLDQGISLRNNVVVQGSGKWATVVTYAGNYPFVAQGLQLIGLRNFTLKNGGNATEGAVIKNNDMVIFQNVVFDLGRQKQSFLDGNTNIEVNSCDFFQRGAINQQSPFLFSGGKGLIFTNNYVEFVMGASAFERVTDAYIAGNTFTRQASAQNDPGTLHMITIDFASRIAIIGNTFQTNGGAITNYRRNDGESILTEGGGAQRTENLGTVSSAGANTIFDPSLQLNTNPIYTVDGRMPENYGIAIVSGKGVGQTRYITGFNGGTVTVDRAWDVVPDGSSKYSTFVWGLEKSILKGNVFRNMPRGIWLYQAALRDVDVIGNNFSEGGGVYLRAYQNLDTKMFDPMYNIRIADNSVSNSTGLWTSHAIAMFVNHDARAFGVAFTGIEFRNNSLVANRPNISSGWEEYAGNEGYFNMMRVENYDRYESLYLPRLWGTIFQRNSCTNCQVDYRVGTGAAGTIIDSPRSVNSGKLLDNWRTANSPEVATGTIVR